MPRKYHTLLLNTGTPDAPAWGVEFGDYDKATVEAERDEYRNDWLAKDLRIITTSDGQAAIDAEVAKLNNWRNGGAA